MRVEGSDGTCARDRDDPCGCVSQGPMDAARALGKS